jgi:hypothetical protein
MLTILGYYLYYTVTDGGLELPKATATGIVGAYGGLVYLSTVLGGWIADRLLGMERTVVYGGVVVMCGHIALASMPGLAGVAVGLVLVALGSGALKANASSLLGSTPKRLAKPIGWPNRVRSAGLPSVCSNPAMGVTVEGLWAKVALHPLQGFHAAQHISDRRGSRGAQHPASPDRRVQVVSPGQVAVRRDVSGRRTRLISNAVRRWSRSCRGAGRRRRHHGPRRIRRRLPRPVERPADFRAGGRRGATQ